MAITLDLQTVPAYPVTPRSAAQIIFDNNYAKLATLPLKQKLVIALLGQIHAASGTNDFRTNHAALIQSAKVFFGGQSTPIDQAAAQANEKFMYGYLVSGTDSYVVNPLALSSYVNTLLAVGKDFLEQSEEDLVRQIAFLSLIHA